MNNIISIILTLAALITVRNAVAVLENLLLTQDGNIWEVLDELEPGKSYTVVFNTQGDNIPENDEVIFVNGKYE